MRTVYYWMHPPRTKEGESLMIELDPAVKPTMSVDEFAAITGVSRSSAFAAVHAGEVPAIRLGKRIRIPTAAVRRMLALDDPVLVNGGGDAPAA
jgi:excisionase family DNA binding protein